MRTGYYHDSGKTEEAKNVPMHDPFTPCPCNLYQIFVAKKMA